MGEAAGRRWLRRRCRDNPPAPVPEAASGPWGDTDVDSRAAATEAAASRRAEAEALTSQARWLLEYHGRRSDSTYQRGTAALAANGVLLGLIATAVRTQTGGFTVTEQITLLLAVWLVLASAVFALAAIAPRKTAAASVDDLQTLYANRRGSREGLVHDDIATTLLGVAKGHPPDKNPVAEAAREARARIRWFKWSVRWLAAAVASLVAFVVYAVSIR